MKGILTVVCPDQNGRLVTEDLVTVKGGSLTFADDGAVTVGIVGAKPDDMYDNGLHLYLKRWLFATMALRTIADVADGVVTTVKYRLDIVRDSVERTRKGKNYAVTQYRIALQGRPTEESRLSANDVLALCRGESVFPLRVEGNTEVDRLRKELDALKQQIVVPCPPGRPSQASRVSLRRITAGISLAPYSTVYEPGLIASCEQRLRRASAMADACWLSHTGTMRIDGKQVPTMRVAWEIVNGPLPEGQALYPVCGNRHCCRPSHRKLVLSAHCRRAA